MASCVPVLSGSEADAWDPHPSCINADNSWPSEVRASLHGVQSRAYKGTRSSGPLHPTSADHKITGPPGVADLGMAVPANMNPLGVPLKDFNLPGNLFETPPSPNLLDDLDSLFPYPMASPLATNSSNAHAKPSSDLLKQPLGSVAEADHGERNVVSYGGENGEDLMGGFPEIAFDPMETPVDSMSLLSAAIDTEAGILLGRYGQGTKYARGSAAPQANLGSRVGLPDSADAALAVGAQRAAGVVPLKSMEAPFPRLMASHSRPEDHSGNRESYAPLANPYQASGKSHQLEAISSRGMQEDHAGVYHFKAGCPPHGTQGLAPHHLQNFSHFAAPVKAFNKMREGDQVPRVTTAAQPTQFVAESFPQDDFQATAQGGDNPHPRSEYSLPPHMLASVPSLGRKNNNSPGRTEASGMALSGSHARKMEGQPSGKGGAGVGPTQGFPPPPFVAANSVSETASQSVDQTCQPNIARFAPLLGDPSKKLKKRGSLKAASEGVFLKGPGKGGVTKLSPLSSVTEAKAVSEMQCGSSSMSSSKKRKAQEEGLDGDEDMGGAPEDEDPLMKRLKAAESHNQSEKRRREKINDKLRTLQELIPNSSRLDKASTLDEAITYMQALKAQIEVLSKHIQSSQSDSPSMHGMPSLPSMSGSGSGSGGMIRVDTPPRHPHALLHTTSESPPKFDQMDPLAPGKNPSHTAIQSAPPGQHPRLMGGYTGEMGGNSFGLNNSNQVSVRHGDEQRQLQRRRQMEQQLQSYSHQAATSLAAPPGQHRRGGSLTQMEMPPAAAPFQQQQYQYNLYHQQQQQQQQQVDYSKQQGLARGAMPASSSLSGRSRNLRSLSPSDFGGPAPQAAQYPHLHGKDVAVTPYQSASMTHHYPKSKPDFAGPSYYPERLRSEQGAFPEPPLAKGASGGYGAAWPAASMGGDLNSYGAVAGAAPSNSPSPLEDAILAMKRENQALRAQLMSQGSSHMANPYL